MTTTVPGRSALVASAAPLAMAGSLRRAARLISEQGWCQGMAWAGDPYAPTAVSLVGAVRWAVAGDARHPGLTAAGGIELTRRWLDPYRSAPFTDLELVTAWNDAPSRTRAQVVRTLVDASRGVLRAEVPVAAGWTGAAWPAELLESHQPAA